MARGGAKAALAALMGLSSLCVAAVGTETVEFHAVYTGSAGDATAFLRSPPSLGSIPLKVVKGAGNGVGTIKYEKSLSETGWNNLHLATVDSYSDNLQAQAAGMLEGFATAEQISQQFTNANLSMGSSGQVSDTASWVAMNTEWAMVMAETNGSAFWQAAGLAYQQQIGMYYGYQMARAQMPGLWNAGWADWVAFIALPDLGDIQIAVKRKHRPDPFRNYIERTHCSSMMRLSPKTNEPADVFFGHTTWSEYFLMIRIFKSYDLRYSISKASGSNLVSFSSYPVLTWSLDDFYALGSDMIVIETTNSVFDNRLYKNLTPQSLLTWVRVNVANKLSRTSKEWVDNFGTHNSGTYNNQWMALDLKALEKDTTNGTKLAPGAFHIIETWPVGAVITDVTDVVNEQGYWPSYNVPYSKRVFDILGYPEAIILGGKAAADMLSYDHCKRADLFRSYHKSVSTLEDLGHVLRSNNYLTNPVSEHNPYYAISSRPDLADAKVNGKDYSRQCFGGLDSKVTSATAWKKRIVNAVAGPTTNFGTLPLFNFSNTLAPCAKGLVGMPESYNFTWQTFHGPMSN